MKISILCHTARVDYCLAGNPNYHVFQVLLDSVINQDFPAEDVEVIFIDARYSQRHHLFDNDGHGFNGVRYACAIKHVDQTEGNPYFKYGLWVEALALNKGIVHATGELLMTTADKSGFLTPNILSKAWHYYKEHNQFLLVGWHNLTFGSTIPEGYADDHRYGVIQSEGLTVKEVQGGWFYGYAFYSLEAALKVNGYDIALDCTKGVVDCDMGLRLANAGYKFVIDTELYMSRYAVTNYAFLNIDPIPGVVEDPLVPRPLGAFKPNVGIMAMNNQAKRYKVNNLVLTPAHIARTWEIFREDYPNNNTDYPPVPGTPDYTLLAWWYNNQVLIDLRRERELIAQGK